MRTGQHDIRDYSNGLAGRPLMPSRPTRWTAGLHRHLNCPRQSRSPSLVPAQRRVAGRNTDGAHHPPSGGGEFRPRPSVSPDPIGPIGPDRAPSHRGWRHFAAGGVDNVGNQLRPLGCLSRVGHNSDRW